jgi:ferritin-like metal-binding protein YciE
MTGIEEQLTAHLADAHAIEEQALAQLRPAPKIAGDPLIADAFEAHLTETEAHEGWVRGRLEARGARPSPIKDGLMKAGGAGFVLFARLQPDTPGKLLAHAYSYEHLEEASYEQLALVADRAGDDATAGMARRVRDEERAMGERLAGLYDRAVGASRGDDDDPEAQLVRSLRDAHAIEAQADTLLGRAAESGGDAGLEELYAAHRDEERNHRELLRVRLAAHGARPSRFKDSALRAGGLNWSALFQGRPDTPGTLAAFVYAFEHLQIAGCEQLLRVAERAGDAETGRAVKRILAEERATARQLRAAFERATDATLEAQGVAV